MTVWMILVAVLSLLYLMNFMKFDSLMSNVVSSKLDVISSSIETSIMKAERLGIPLKSATNVLDSMQKAKSRDENVTEIEVIDNQGKIVFSTDKKATGFINSDISRRALKSTDKNWNLSTEENLYSGIQIFDSFGNLSGSVVIVYDKASFYSVYLLVRLHLLEMTIAIFLFFAAVVFLVIRFGFADITNVIKLIQQHSEGKDSRSLSVTKGTISYEFAKQIKQSQEMQTRVAKELDDLQDLDKGSSAKKVIDHD
ncbi:hypothetical protein [Marinomonas posidonica]|nr:hypothetical protein [Marinomonas posidonica]